MQDQKDIAAVAGEELVGTVLMHDDDRKSLPSRSDSGSKEKPVGRV